MAATIRNGESVRATRGGLLAGFSVRFCKNVAGRKAPSADELFLIVRAAGGAWVPSLVDADTAEEGDVPSDDVDDRRRPLIVVSSDPFSENLPKYFPRILIFFFDCLGGGGRRLSSETTTIPTIPTIPSKFLALSPRRRRTTVTTPPRRRRFGAAAAKSAKTFDRLWGYDTYYSQHHHHQHHHYKDDDDDDISFLA